MSAADAGALAEQQHLLDAADESFAHLAPGYPDTANPIDFAASSAAGFVPPVDWDVPTGGAL